MFSDSVIEAVMVPNLRHRPRICAALPALSDAHRAPSSRAMFDFHGVQAEPLARALQAFLRDVLAPAAGLEPETPADPLLAPAVLAERHAARPQAGSAGTEPVNGRSGQQQALGT